MRQCVYVYIYLWELFFGYNYMTLKVSFLSRIVVLKSVVIVFIATVYSRETRVSVPISMNCNVLGIHHWYTPIHIYCKRYHTLMLKDKNIFFSIARENLCQRRRTYRRNRIFDDDPLVYDANPSIMLSYDTQ